MAHKYKEPYLWSKRMERDVYFTPISTLGNLPVSTRLITKELANLEATERREVRERVRSNNFDNEIKPSVEEVRQRLGLNKRGDHHAQRL